ncbi:MAG: PEP/pyruvate-binding domain-containing protein [Thermoanaerobaculia bacterium]
MRYLVRFDDDAALDPAQVGPKFAGLARAARAGFPVPPAVAVGTAVQAESVEPTELAAELRVVADEVGLESGVSVRSSATLEDLAGRSFAGVYETFLDVVGEEAVLDRVAESWQSASGEVAASYLKQAGFAGETPGMAVIVQRMVPATAAGVAFSIDPVASGSGEAVVEAVAGLGDRLVAGHVTPWRAFVTPAGALRVEPPAGEEGESPPLGEEQWLQVAELVRRVAKAFGGPQDIEWAADPEGRIWLLQARPITAVRRRAEEIVPGTWTRRIAVDLWADQLTPFLADHMLRTAPRWDFSGARRFVGIPEVQPVLGVIHGFLYVNCAALEKVLTIVPRGLRIPDLVDLFPPGTDTDRVPPPRPGKLLSVAIRAAAQGVVVPQSNLLLCEWLSRRGLERLGRRLETVETSTPADAAGALGKVRAATETLAQLQIRNQWPYLYATVFTSALRWLATGRYGLSHGEFLQLISGGMNNVTSDIEQEFRRIAAMIAENRALAERLEENESIDLEQLPAPVRRELDRFLGRFGCRSRNRAITYRRWAEAPDEVLGMVRTLVRRPAAAATRSEDREAGREVLGRVRVPGRWLLVAVQRFARRYLDLREDLRFFLDRILFLIRRALLELGEITGLGDDVLFLTDAELGKLVAGGLEAERAQQLAAQRRRELAAHTEAASFIIDGRPVDEPTAKGELLVGIGTSPGRKTGRARIVRDPTAGELDEGDILVAANTDPGWTPVLSVVHGVVVEEGGLLNHCSIVARELGIPAVVGVRGATRAIPDGATITIDGDSGTVRVRER